MLKLIIRFLFGERKVLENHKKVLEKSWNFIAQHQWEPCTRFSFLLIYFEYPVLKFLNSLTLLGDTKSEYYYCCLYKKCVYLYLYLKDSTKPYLFNSKTCTVCVFVFEKCIRPQPCPLRLFSYYASDF